MHRGFLGSYLVASPLKGCALHDICTIAASNEDETLKHGFYSEWIWTSLLYLQFRLKLDLKLYHLRASEICNEQFSWLLYNFVATMGENVVWTWTMNVASTAIYGRNKMLVSPLWLGALSTWSRFHRIIVHFQHIFQLSNQMISANLFH